MNKKLLNTIKTCLLVGALSATGLSVIAAPINNETTQKETDADQPVVCAIGYIEDTIVEINEENKTVIVGDATDKEAQIVINLDDEMTRIQSKDKKVYQFEDLRIGQKIGIESNGIMVDGELDAFEIIVVKDTDEVVDVELSTCLIAGYIEETIVGINEETNTIILGDAEDKEAQIIVKITEDTSITHSKNRRSYTIKELEVGQAITLETNGIMTQGQVEAIEITLLEKN